MLFKQALGCGLFIALLCVHPLSAKEKAWLDGKVVANGNTSLYGVDIPNATIVLSDPGSSTTVSRWVIATQSVNGKSQVDLRVGATFKAYRGSIMKYIGRIGIRYTDSKGKEKEELYPILPEEGTR
jgi:hypothetical protein